MNLGLKIGFAILLAKINLMFVKTHCVVGHMFWLLNFFFILAIQFVADSHRLLVSITLNLERRLLSEKIFKISELNG